jgi:hypothetical protein
LTLAIISLVVAIVAALFAAKLYWMQRDEHRVFMTELTRQAEVTVAIKAVAHIQPTATQGASCVVLRITFDNSGTKAAHNTTVNVLVPESVEHFERSRENGSPNPEAAPAVSSHQDVPWSSPSRMLGWNWDVLTIPTNRVVFVCISLDAGAECPIQVNVASEDLPEPHQVNYDYTIHRSGNESAQLSEAVPVK